MATNTEKIVVQVVVKGGKQLDNLDKKTGKATKSVGGLTKGMATMAAGVLAAAATFRMMAQNIGSAIKTFTAFEFQMAKVKAITGATSGDFLKLSKSAEDLGRTTFFTAQQVAELQTNYGKLGFTTQEILNAQEATLLLATATGSDLGRAAIVAGAAVRGFGLDASETERVVDVMAVAFTSSAMDIEKWQTSMTKVAPIAKSAGFSIEDTAAMMSKLTDSGIEASIAGTSLRNILLKMQDPNSDLTKSFGKTIHSFDELVPAMKQFVKEGGSMADIMEVVDLRQAAAFEQMITSADATVILRDSLLDASGAALEMSGIVGDTLEGAFKRLTSAWQGLMINFTESVVGEGLQSFVDGVADMVNVVSDFMDIPMSEKLEEERIALNSMVLQLTEANIKEDARNKLIIKINKQYPKFLENIDTEKTSTSELRKRLNEYNTELLNKIALQIEEENTGEAATKAGKARNKQVKAEMRLLKELIKVSEKHSITLDDGATTSENFSKVQEVLKSRLNGLGSALDPARKSLEGLNGFVVRSVQANQNLTEATTKLNAATEDRDELAKRLGISLEVVTESTNKDSEATKGNTDDTEENTKAKQQNLDVEREMVQLLMNQGVTSKEEEARIQEYLNGLREKEIELQLKSLNEFVMDVDLRKKLLLELEALKAGTDEIDQKRKDDSFKSDVKRAIMSGQTAEQAMKTVVRAQIMEAVAGFIASIFTSVPFPLNLILAAGASAAVGGLIDSQLDKFGSGGVIETFANGGMVNGKSHAQGGEKFAVGGRVVELEGGEAVINKRSTSMFSSQLSAMNAAGGGVKFADGGLLNQPSFSQQQFNALGQNQMMGAMGNSGKVTVVEADITNSQNTVSVIQSQATI
tara:strand:+ start:872 stop:3475 length:2604 start_codon:yes stop_codon:yes gene_type:complete